MNFTANNRKKKKVQTNSCVHGINTRMHHLHRPNGNFSCFQKSSYYDVMRIFNCLPHNITRVKNEKAHIKVALRTYLNIQSFYSVDEFLMCKDNPY